jgi:hypothetical protein
VKESGIKGHVKTADDSGGQSVKKGQTKVGHGKRIEGKRREMPRHRLNVSEL